MISILDARSWVSVRTWGSTLLRLLWVIYFLLTSIYCLLAYLPYTYCALIKAPPYAWIPWFSHHYTILYWFFFVVLVAERALRGSVRSHRLLLFGMGAAGVAITRWPLLPNLQDNEVSYVWSLASLLPIAGLSIADLLKDDPKIDDQQNRICPVPYSSICMAGAFVALLYSGAAEYRKCFANGGLIFRPYYEFPLVFWSLISHVMIAVAVLSVLNLLWLAAAKSKRPARIRLVLLSFLVFAAAWFTLARFLDETFSFDGWRAYVYSAALSAVLTLSGSSVMVFLRLAQTRQPVRNAGRAAFVFVWSAMSLLAIALPVIIGGGDWNGILQETFTLIFWAVLASCASALSPTKRQYSLAAVIAIFVVTASAYKGLQASEIFWARSVGRTDDEITKAMESYANTDPSFQLAHHILGNSPPSACGDLCRIMRQYTNIRDAKAKFDLKLVDTMVPAPGQRPNIFIFVIDSMRADYVGAYNPRVDFTPNLDKLAHDGVALKNVYTQYAGTSLSEPAIWAGAELLHAHFLQPFEKVNSLERLAATDNYQLVVSYDTVLTQLLPPNAPLLKLDTDKLMWNNFEACSTVQQLESALDSRPDNSQPVLFYAQPMNVHQFARNNRPSAAEDGWKMRPGFNNRIAHAVNQVDQCLGGFFQYLRDRNLYDESIVIITADHGDATADSGRTSHSIWIYPEIMRVPLIFHLPAKLRRTLVYDDSRILALTDVTPSLYYLLGHKPILRNAMLGRPLFAESKDELESYTRDDLFLASDVRADYGILADRGRWLYVTYDSPPQSMLFDLESDPNAQHNIVTAGLKKTYDEQIIGNLEAIAAFYQYRPGGASWLTASK